jgi:hypothetical protein
MIFKGEGSVVVWDRERERELCRFDKGIFESNDPRTCAILVSLGYEGEGELPVVEDDELIALRARAKELQVRNWHTMKKDSLVAAIAEAEKAAEQ